MEEELEGFAHAVIGAAIEVHRLLGPGLAEAVYEEALCVELGIRDIYYVRQPLVSVLYKGRTVGDNRLDLLVANMLVVELKSVEVLLPVHKAQLVAYLKITNNRLGLLINFNVPYLKEGLNRVIL